MWRTHVSIPDRFGPEVSDFLDKHAEKGKLSKTGIYKIKDPIDEIVPYELLPLRIKKVVNMIPLSRDKFKTASAFKAALYNLHIYGYLPDVDRGLIEKQRYWSEFRRKWQMDHPENMRKHIEKRKNTGAQGIWDKKQQDMALYHTM